jgi:hypothetical protein
MTDDNRLQGIERRLDEHGDTLRRIEEGLKNVAVQGSRLGNVERDVEDIYSKWNHFVEPDGPLSVIKGHQASCPRSQIKFLWWFVVGVAIAFIGLSGSLLHLLSNKAPGS